MMKIQVSILCVFYFVFLSSLSEGNDEASECFTDMKNCLVKRLCYSRTKSIDLFCCRQSFLEENFVQQKYDNCSEERFNPDISDCLVDMNAECQITLLGHFAENLEKYEEMDRKLKQAVAVPSNAEQCDFFSRTSEEECLQLCESNTEKGLEWMCDVLQEIMKESPIMQEKCVEKYTDCLVTEITEKDIENVTVSCCKQSLEQNGDFFEHEWFCSRYYLRKNYLRCYNLIGETCKRNIRRYIFEREDSSHSRFQALRKFKKQIDALMELPESADKCVDYYTERKNLILKSCEHNIDEKLKWYCDRMVGILKNNNELAH